MDPTLLKRLRKVLAELYPDTPSIRRVAADAGMDLSRLTLDSTNTNNWHSVLREAQLIHKVDDLLSVVEDEYGTNKTLSHICVIYRQETDKTGHIDKALRPSLNEANVQHGIITSEIPESRQTDKQDVTESTSETADDEAVNKQYLEVENAIRSHPDFRELLQKFDFIPREERNGREITIVSPKFVITCKLPIAISNGWCLIEFSDPFLRGLTISLTHKEVLQQLLIGRHTPFQWNSRRFIRELNNGEIRLSIGAVEIRLTKADATDLCECVDKIIDVYVASMMEAENILEAWNRSVGRQYEDSDYYGYEMLTVSVETWREIMQFARDSPKSSQLEYRLYALNSSFQIETSPDIHVEIAPKFSINNDGFPIEETSLLYIVSPTYRHETAWQDKVGTKGLWTVKFTKNWLLKRFLPLLQNPSARDDLERRSNPNIFWNINEPYLFSYHLRTIHSWAWRNGNNPTHLFINYCQAFNKLLKQATMEDKSDSWGYILQRLPISKGSTRATEKNSRAFVHEELQTILVNNLKYLQEVDYIPWDDLDYMFRGHCALIEDFKINSTQSAINEFKKAVWPLFERASFESRFCHLD